MMESYLRNDARIKKAESEPTNIVIKRLPVQELQLKRGKFTNERRSVTPLQPRVIGFEETRSRIKHVRTSAIT